MINSSWPYIVAISFFVAVAYAILVAWLNNHPRYGEFWRQHEWIEVVIGSLMIAVTVWTLIGLLAFLILLGVYVVFGAPMIVAVLVADMRRVARERDEEIAEKR